MNNVCIIGRITKDIEVKTIQSGSTVAMFSIAVDRFDKNKNKVADFFAVKAWGSNADFIGKYFHKGDPVEIIGELRNETYEKDGQKRTLTIILVNKVGFCIKNGAKNAQATEDKGEIEF